MKHTTLDCYGCNQHYLENMMMINQLLTNITYQLDLDPISPPHLIPYYYGRVKEDIGISAYVLLKGGHITIHTFPIRECYFVDVFCTKEYDEKELYNYFLENLPFSEKNSNVSTKDRSVHCFDMLPYSPDCDFGPHLMTEIIAKNKLNMESMYDFLEHLVFKINMDPIIRAVVNKSTLDNPEYLSGIIIIAQSHIALHYEYKTGTIYADLFSCAPFDYSTVEEEFKKIGEIISNELVIRGTKHIYKVKSSITDDDLKASIKWQNTIGINK